MHVTKDAKKNLEPTIQIGIFLGYTDTPHNYRVYFPNNRMIVVKWDIKFDEEKAMRLSLERELDLYADEELLVPNNEPQDVEQPHVEDHGVAENTHAEPSTRNGRRRTMDADRLRLDATEHVGAPTSLCRQRQSPGRFIGCMALMSKCIVTEPSSLEEVVHQPIWVDTMVGEHDSIVKKSAWEVVPRPVGKLVVGSRWIYKVKQAADGSVDKYKAIFVA